MQFRSDNNAPAAPEILAAIAAANDGDAPAYGADDWTARLEARVAEVFERDCAVFLVSTGTAANALALAAATPPWGSVLTHRTAHIEEDECGAPEFYTGGAKLVLVDGAAGRLDPARLAAELRAQGARGVHQAQPAVLSLTQATERGTLYSIDQIGALAEMAKARGLAVHLDGTRFANALARTGATPAEMSWRAGVDLLCLGATKLGAIAAEAIIVFEPRLAETLGYRRKRGGHLLSKMRFAAAQMLAWLEDDLWLRLAGRANAMADRLAAGLATIPSVEILEPVEANMLFVETPLALHQALEAAGAAYYLDPPDQDPAALGPRVGARLVCSHATTEAEVDALLAAASAPLAAE